MRKGQVIGFILFLLVSACADMTRKFEVGDCLVAVELERWENPMILKVLHIGKKSYRVMKHQNSTRTLSKVPFTQENQYEAIHCE